MPVFYCLMVFWSLVFVIAMVYSLLRKRRIYQFNQILSEKPDQLEFLVWKKSQWISWENLFNDYGMWQCSCHTKMSVRGAIMVMPFYGKVRNKNYRGSILNLEGKFVVDSDGIYFEEN